MTDAADEPSVYLMSRGQWLTLFNIYKIKRVWKLWFIYVFFIKKTILSICEKIPVKLYLQLTKIQSDSPDSILCNMCCTFQGIMQNELIPIYCVSSADVWI